jgi:hypothetical protein
MLKLLTLETLLAKIWAKNVSGRNHAPNMRKIGHKPSSRWPVGTSSFIRTVTVGPGISPDLLPLQNAGACGL